MAQEILCKLVEQPRPRTPRIAPVDHHLELLWCPNARSGRSNGWSFPPRVDRLLRDICQGSSVLQLFGGLSKWGLKLDIDPVTRPHVIGDAWLPPFKRDAFDVVIIDPPYHHINQQMKSQLLTGAAYIARRHVIWFHVLWVASGSGLKYERGWLVRVGDSCQVRCIQVFRPPSEKKLPAPYFSRGPAMKYNRWLGPQIPLAI